MKKHMKYIFAAILILTSLTANAQGHARVYYGNYKYRYAEAKPRLINWLPEEETPQRFTIAVRPYQFFNSGFKADFEFELSTAGQWLQFSLAGYHKPQYDYYGPVTRYNYRYEGWENLLSGYHPFEKMTGAGVGAAYKRMFSDNGWYWSAGMNFNFYDVSYKERGYYMFYEDDMQFFEETIQMERSQFYKLVFNVNIGKHFALSRNLFLDTYIGLGYERTFIGGYDTGSFNNMCAFGYSGLCFNSGLRLGWMWPNKK